VRVLDLGVDDFVEEVLEINRPFTSFKSILPGKPCLGTFLNIIYQLVAQSHGLEEKVGSQETKKWKTVAK